MELLLPSPLTSAQIPLQTSLSGVASVPVAQQPSAGCPHETPWSSWGVQRPGDILAISEITMLYSLQNLIQVSG